MFFQEARRTAEKVVVIANIDDRVNTTVTATNHEADAEITVAVKSVQNGMHDVIDDRPLETIKVSCV